MSTEHPPIRIPSLYLPPAELILSYRCGVVFVDRSMKWEKKRLFNRTYILGPNGIQTLTVPVLSTGGVSAALSDIRISYQQDWIRVHTGALAAAYNSSPFFPMFRDELFSVYSSKPEFLVELNDRLNNVILKRLCRSSGINEIDSCQNQPSYDFRHLNDLRSIQAELTPMPGYRQVFCERTPFTPYLSWVDWLSCTGGSRN